MRRLCQFRHGRFVHRLLVVGQWSSMLQVLLHIPLPGPHCMMSVFRQSSTTDQHSQWRPLHRPGHSSPASMFMKASSILVPQWNDMSMETCRLCVGCYWIPSAREVRVRAFQARDKIFSNENEITLVDHCTRISGHHEMMEKHVSAKNVHIQTVLSNQL